MAYSYKWALARFNDVLREVENGTQTPVYNVTSQPLTTVQNRQVVLGSVPHGSAVWQHTDKWHVAMIYIEKGHGQLYNRALLDMIASGVDTPAKFKRAWVAKNGKSGYGTFPSVKSSRTSSVRASQASYIVADFNKRQNPHSHIPKMDGAKTTHRTHLISAQTTGIENHKGLLIEFDGWLNMYPMNKFEQAVLEQSRKQDIIWVCEVYQAHDGLHLRYVIYNSQWREIARKEWVDDRWTYLWYYDEGQEASRFTS